MRTFFLDNRIRFCSLNLVLQLFGGRIKNGFLIVLRVKNQVLKRVTFLGFSSDYGAQIIISVCPFLYKNKPIVI